MRKAVAVLVVLTIMLGVGAVLCSGCGSTQKNQQGRFPKGVIGTFQINMIPTCPSLKGLTPEQSVEVVKAYFDAVKTLANSEGFKLPTSIQITFDNLLNQIQTGEVSPTATTTAEIQASIQEAFKDFVKSPGQ